MPFPDEERQILREFYEESLEEERARARTDSFELFILGLLLGSGISTTIIMLVRAWA